MKINTKIRYKNKPHYGSEPAYFHAVVHGNTTNAVITLDPILKKHRDLHKAILDHEKNAIAYLSQGKSNARAHRLAKMKEPLLTRRLRGKKQFWSLIKKRQVRK